MQCFRHVVVQLENYLKRKKHSNGKKEIQNLIGEIKSIETFSIAQYENLETKKNIHKSKIRFIYVIMLKSKQKNFFIKTNVYQKKSNLTIGSGISTHFTKSNALNGARSVSTELQQATLNDKSD